jgi:hypothetical protein
METYIEKVKTTLYDLIHEMSEHYWLYVSDPKRNFSRDRKLPFEKMIAMLVSMGGGSLRNELIDYFEKVTGAKIRDHIEELVIATPATFARYSNAFRGNIYGYTCTALDGAVPRKLRAEEERYIPGLDFVGSAGVRAHGYSSVITNGYDVAGDALEKMGGAQ